MAGIYIHIPFCKSRCIYCGFYSTTLSEIQEQYIDCICNEIHLRENYLPESYNNIKSIYLGGGTPSVLSVKLLNRLFDTIYNKVSSPQEIEETTIECNPDDVTVDFANHLPQLEINRVSMGVQTFDDNRLKWIHRRHTSQQVYNAVNILHSAGISNISIDLIFGFPDETIDEWKSDIDKALSLDVEHISAYNLMYEKGTQLYKLLKSEKIKEIDEELSRTMYETLIDKLAVKGYEHYEISNFAKQGKKAIHNSSYWQAIPYIGLGAAAHSYDGNNRQWNISDAKEYINSITKGIIPMTKEILSTDEKYNDIITTELRTSDGICINNITNKFGKEYSDYMLNMSVNHIKDGMMEINNGRLKLTKDGIFVSNYLMSDLIKV